MSEQRFEDLVRSIGAASSRRGALRVIGRALLVALGGIVLRPAQVLAGGLAAGVCDNVNDQYRICLRGCPNDVERRGCRAACLTEKRREEKVICGQCGYCAPNGNCKPICTERCSQCRTELGLDICDPPQLESWQACCPSSTDLNGWAVANIQSDPQNCGACGVVCPAGQSCFNGTCYACSSGQTDCSGQCVDLQSDPANCGACGQACAAGSSCVAGTCTTPCAGGLTRCDGTCVDLQSDEQHCGSCGTPCTSGFTCVSGTCSATCPAERTCGSTCCGPDQRCFNNVCICSLPSHSCGDQCCPTFYECVHGECLAPCGDSHCAAGLVCSQGHVAYCCPVLDSSNECPQGTGQCPNSYSLTPEGGCLGGDGGISCTCGAGICCEFTPCPDCCPIGYPNYTTAGMCCNTDISLCVCPNGQTLVGGQCL